MHCGEWEVPPNFPRPEKLDKDLQEVIDKISPNYYKSKTGLEVLDVIEAFDLGNHEGNILKYIVRYRKKNGLEDLKKAQFYLTRLIEIHGKNAND